MSEIRKRRGSSGKLSLKTMSIHFAVITMAATVLLAVFSEGERTAASAATPEPDTYAPDKISRAALGDGSNAIAIVQHNDVTPGTFGPDMHRPHTTSSTAYLGDEEVGYEPTGLNHKITGQQLPAALPPGMTLEEWLALQDEKNDEAPPMQLTAEQLRALQPSGTMQNATPVGPGQNLP